MEARVREGELVLLGPSSEMYIGLDASGAAVWDRVAKCIRFDELVAGLAEDYEASPDQIAADVRPLIDELEANGLIERVTQDSE